VFFGGDAEEDLPQVSLERETMPGSGVYAEVRNRTGRVVGSRGRDVLLTYTPSPIDVEPGKAQAHYWTAEWQAVGWSTGTAIGLSAALAVPLGRYRLSAVGKSGGTPYRVSSQPFVVTADEALKLTATRSGVRISGQAFYPVGAGYRLLSLSGPSDGNVPASSGLKLVLKSRKDGKSESLSPTVTDGNFAVDATVDMSAGAVIDVEDAAGNHGTLVVN